MVAVKARDADRYAASPPEGVRLFLVYGNDAGGVTERARQIERVALKRGGGDSVMRFGSDQISADPGRIADEAHAASLFGGEPVISLRMLDGRHNVIGAVQPLIERPPEASWLVVEAADLNPTSPLRKAFEASPRAAALPVFQTEGRDLISMVRSMAEDAGKTIEPAAIELLSESLGADRLASRGEIEKLFLYAGDAAQVTLADVEAVVGDNVEARVDQIVDAALLGDSEGLELGLDRLRAEGGSTSGLATQALRHLVALQGMRASVDAGVSADTAAPQHFRRRRDTVIAELRRWPSAELAAARTRIADAVYLTRLTPALDPAAISQAFHETALQSRKLRRAETRPLRR
jgi:DNA polymerase-3 subunit delta